MNKYELIDKLIATTPYNTCTIPTGFKEAIVGYVDKLITATSYVELDSITTYFINQVLGVFCFDYKDFDQVSFDMREVVVQYFNKNKQF